MNKTISRQFEKPEGTLGSFIGTLMSLKNRNRIDWIVSLMNVKPGERILEIGYGPGVAIKKIGKKIGNGKIVGVDHSLTMLKQAAKRNSDLLERDKLLLHAGTIDDLNRHILFDKVFAINVNLFWKDPVGEMKKIYNLLNPYGELFIALQPYYAKDDNHVRKISVDIESQMIKAGFTIKTVEFKKMSPISAFCAVGIKG